MILWCTPMPAVRWRAIGVCGKNERVAVSVKETRSSFVVGKEMRPPFAVPVLLFVYRTSDIVWCVRRAFVYTQLWELWVFCSGIIAAFCLFLRTN